MITGPVEGHQGLEISLELGMITTSFLLYFALVKINIIWIQSPGWFITDTFFHAELMKRTPSSNPDHQRLQDAQGALKNVMMYVASGMTPSRAFNLQESQSDPWTLILYYWY